MSGNTPYGESNGMGSGGAGCSWGVKTDANNQRVSTHGDVTANATITAHFTWVDAYPGEEPPKSVVIYKLATAQYISGQNQGGQGTINTTLSHEVDDPIYGGGPPSAPPKIIGHKKTGHKYLIKNNPGYGFDEPCTPTAHVEGDGIVGPPEVVGAGSASVTYKADTYIVSVGLDGVTTENQYDEEGMFMGTTDKILIGQGVTASLSGVGTFSNWNWTIEGKIFSEFKVTRPDAEKGNVVEVAADEKTKANPHWHWKEPTSATITVTASVTVEGETLGDVTAERTVEVVPPNFTFTKQKGSVIKRPYGSLGVTWTIGPLGNNLNFPDGCNWTSSASAPSPFVGGRWHFVQIISPSRHRDFDTGTTPYPDFPFNTKTGLDTTYAYAPGPFLPAQPDDPQAPAGYADSMLHPHGDSPFVNVNDTVNHLTVHDKYEVFLMYEPSPVGSQDVQWVPLHALKWEWNTDVGRPGSTWNMPMSNLGEVSFTLNGEKDFPDFPYWELRVH